MSFEGPGEKEKVVGSEVALYASGLCAVLAALRLGVAGSASLDVDLARWLFDSSSVPGPLSGWLFYGAFAWIVEILAVGTTAWLSASVLPHLGYGRRYVIALNVVTVFILQAMLAFLPRWLGVEG